MVTATQHENYDTLLASHLGLYNSQALVRQDKAALVGSLLSEGEFSYVPRRDYCQLQALHKNMITFPNFPRGLLQIDSFVRHYNEYAPESGDFEDSLVAKARPRLASMPAGARREIEGHTAALLVEAVFSDSRVRHALESPPATSYKQAKPTICIGSIEVALESGDILEYGAGVREAVRRTQELHYGVFSKVVQVDPRTFPERVAHHILLRTGTLPYERITKDVAEGSNELAEKYAKSGDAGFGAIVMAKSTDMPSLDQAKEAIGNARQLCRDGGVFIMRESPESNHSYVFDDLVDAARQHFGAPVDHQQDFPQRRNIDNPPRLAVFRAA